jgi:hypothetical protein
LSGFGFFQSNDPNKTLLSELKVLAREAQAIHQTIKNEQGVPWIPTEGGNERYSAYTKLFQLAHQLEEKDSDVAVFLKNTEQADLLTSEVLTDEASEHNELLDVHFKKDG